MERYLLKKMQRCTIRAVCLFTLLFFSTFQITNAQDKSIGVNTLTPDKSAALEILANNKGLLIPRINLQSVTDAVTISNPANTLIVYNLNPNIVDGFGEGYYYNDNAGNPQIANWVKLPTSISDAWLISGNAGLNSTNFVGTLDDVDMIFKSHNQEGLRVTTGGALLATGDVNEPTSPIAINTDKGMAWVPAKSAFRAGKKIGINNNDFATIGQNSFGFGSQSKQSGDNSVGIGSIASVSGSNSISIGGGNSNVSGNSSVKIGGGVNGVKSNFSMLFGNASGAHANNSTAFSYGIADGKFSTAMGYVIMAKGTASTAFGGGDIQGGGHGYLYAQARAGWAIGMWNDSLKGINPDVVGNNDRVFVIGNGTTSISRGDALFVERDGDLVIQGIMIAKNGMVGPSDIRLKENITPFEHVLDKVDKIQPIYFNFKDGKTYSEDHQLGFIAQEIQQQFPELVKQARNGYLSVNYGAMNTVVIEAIKEQQSLLVKNTDIQRSMEEQITLQKASVRDHKLLLKQLNTSNKKLEKRTKDLEKLVRKGK